MASGHITSWRIEREQDFIYLGSKITAVTAAMELKGTCFLEGKL